ncbi:MAG: ParA family protein [Planctomycetota bacterium]|nr:ParA family protein [Planctomycetota bacterium]MDP6988498.1 ParA family protein [Planctomycetota bacterium]
MSAPRAFGIAQAVGPVHTLAFVNQKGGCGKTTAAVHLAGALAAVGERVLLVDLDPQAHATLALGCALDSEPSAAELLCDGLWVEEVVLSAAGGIDLLPGGASLAGFEHAAAGRKGAEHILRNALATVAARYDFVLVDCPPRTEGLLAANALAACDTAVLVVEAGLFALHGAESAIDVLDRLAARVGCAPFLRVVATLFDRRSSISRELLVAIQARHGDDLFDTVIQASDSLREATVSGLPVHLADPGCDAARTFAFLADEVRVHAHRDAVGVGEPLSRPAPPGASAPTSRPTRRPMNGLALLCNLHAAGPVTLRRLRSAGLHSLAQLEDVSEVELASIMNGPVGLARRFVREGRQLSGRLEAEAGMRDADEFRAAANDEDPTALCRPSEEPWEVSAALVAPESDAHDDLARSEPARERKDAPAAEPRHPSERDLDREWDPVLEEVRALAADEESEEDPTSVAPAWPVESCEARPSFELPAELRHPADRGEAAAVGAPAPTPWPEWPRKVAEVPPAREPAPAPQAAEQAAEQANERAAIEPSGAVEEDDPLVLVEWPAGGIVHPWGLHESDEPSASPTRVDHAMLLRPALAEGLTEAICARLRAGGVGTLGQLATTAGLELAQSTGIPLPLLLGLGRRARRLLGWPGIPEADLPPQGPGTVDPATIATLAGCTVSHTRRHPTDTEVPHTP